MGNDLKPGEKEIVKSPYGTYKRYFLTDEELQKYRDLPPDEFWKTNKRPIRLDEFSQKNKLSDK